MIGVIEGQVYELAPLTVTNADFSIRIDTDMVAKAYIGESRIEYGVIWFSFGKSCDINAKTGQITVNESGKATIRGIFGDFHHDLELTVTAS